jgi:hypothetical protein
MKIGRDARLQRGTLSVSNPVLGPTLARRFPFGPASRRFVWLVPLFSLAVIIEIFVPRFGVKSPSLVDDWFSMTYAPAAVHQLLHGHYDASVVDYAGRYRPSYAILGDVQWMFGSRNATFAPTLIGLLRLLFFAGGVSAIVAVLLRGTASRTWLIVAVSVVPMMIVATRGVSYNFVRFGVDEPTAAAAIALGLAGMTAAVRRSLRESDRAGIQRSAALVAASYAVYAFGAYMSEASAAVVVLLPALYYWISREPGFVRSRASTTTLATAAGLIVLPIAHVLLETAPSFRHGSSGGETAGVVRHLLTPIGATVAGTLTTADLAWPILILVALGASARRALRRDRYAVLMCGMIGYGFAAAFIANVGTAGTALSRYYIPLLMAVGVAFVWLLQDVNPTTRSVILGAVLLVLFMGRGDLVAKKWLAMDRAGDSAIVLASEAYATGCPVYLIDFPEERRMGLARVLDKNPVHALRSCRAEQASHAAYAIWWQINSRAASPVYPPKCRTKWSPVANSGSVLLARCRRFTPSGLSRDQDTLTPMSIVRLMLPSRWIDASRLNGLAYVIR